MRRDREIDSERTAKLIGKALPASALPGCSCVPAARPSAFWPGRDLDLDSLLISGGRRREASPGVCFFPFERNKPA
jgi:hypothetical protein